MLNFTARKYISKSKTANKKIKTTVKTQNDTLMNV